MGAKSKIAPIGGWGSLKRALQIVLVTFFHGFNHLAMEYLDKHPRVSRLLKVNPPSRGERLRSFLEELGGTFVKIGQMLALQPDVVSMDTCYSLYKLLDRVAPFPYRDVERIVEEELGQSPNELFTRLEVEPLATASIGQVHVAYLGPEKVALKVQRPNAAADFMSDIGLIRAVVYIITLCRIKSLQWLTRVVDEFVAWTEEELDYRYEASVAKKQRLLAQGSRREYVPFVYERFTTRRTLVVEFLDGVTLLDYLRASEDGRQDLESHLSRRGFERESFANNVLQNFLDAAFKRGLYHADLHPANLIIMNNSAVGYIDFGIAGVISKYYRRHLVSMTHALAEGRIADLHLEYMQLSSLVGGADPEGFRAELAVVSRHWYVSDANGKRLSVSFTRVMGDMLRLSRRYGVFPEPDIVKYIRSAIAIDGLNSRFKPGFHAGERISAVCRKYTSIALVERWMTPERWVSFLKASLRMFEDSVPVASRLWKEKFMERL